MKRIGIIIGILMTMSYMGCDMILGTRMLETEIRGSVINAITEEPLVNAHLTLQRYHSGFIGTGGGDEKLADIYTDSKGEFEYIIELEENGWYGIRHEDDENVKSYYNDLYGLVERVDIEEGENNEVELKIAPIARLKTIIENINCIDSTDYFFFHDTTKLGYTHHIDIEIVGCENDYNGGFIEVPMGAYYFYWKTIKGGQITEKYDTIFLNANEYHTNHVKY